MKWYIFTLLLSLVLVSEQRSTPTDDHYIAGVVEYVSQRDTQSNVNHYIDLIRDAASQNADIVVFPEMTLTRGDLVVVPIHGRIKDYPVPALNPNMYHEVLVRISEAARASQVYVVINVQEVMDCARAPEEYCPESKEYRFNTNVVFDRSGAIIDRYRKINLFGEFSRTPALRPELGVFETDFGVTFGHFICFDLMFQVPAVQVVQKHNLTDVIFPTMWFSELPFLTAVEIQEAYAYAANINFLASGANNVDVGSAGSGIYSGKVGALISVMPGTPTTRLLVAKVPKVPGRVAPGSYPGPQYDDPTTQDRLLLKTDPSLTAHVSRVLEPGSQEFTLVDHQVACKFRVKLNYRGGAQMPRLRAFAHDGTNVYVRRSIGVTSCAVVACADEVIGTCPFRYNSNETKHQIETLEIEMNTIGQTYNSTLKCNNALYYPTIVRTNRFPLDVSNFTFEATNQNGPMAAEKNVNREVLKLMLNKPQEDLVSFGIWGRVYSRDTVIEKRLSDVDIIDSILADNRI